MGSQAASCMCGATVTPWPVTPMKRSCPRLAPRGLLRAPRWGRGRSASRSRPRGCGAGAGQRIDLQAVGDSPDLVLARIGTVSRWPVACEERQRSRCWPSRRKLSAPQSPYDAATSTWLIAVLQDQFEGSSAVACVTDRERAAAPKSVRVLSCPVLPNAAFAITSRD